MKVIDHLVKEHLHEEVITVAEAAKLLEADRRTIYGMINDGDLVGVLDELGPRSIRIRTRPFLKHHVKTGAAEHKGSKHRAKRMLRPEDVSEVLKVGIEKARNLIREEKLPGSHRKGSRGLSVTAEPFFKWLDCGQEPLSLLSE